ncbi:MAG TPA: SOS response-associated peptidase [Allosphingosinicella sp.]|nr:SOS response-associated peptidase [Allosphingosinicella sp.]
MCNDYRLLERVPVEEIFAGFGAVLATPEGLPNFEPREDIRITDRAPIVRAAGDGSGAFELVQRRWSWPAPNGRPVYNFRSEGRDLSRGRCLILADGFYEFTANADPAARRKHKWLFTLNGAASFAIAGLWRRDPAVGEAFTMLTTAPGADVAPYHDRGIAVLPPACWTRWLDPAVPAAQLLAPPPAGSLAVRQLA